MKILILSDIHYPVDSFGTIESIIKKETFDKLIFLGDVVDTIYSPLQLTVIWKEFFDKLSQIVPKSKMVILYGDNDICITVNGKQEKSNNYEEQISNAINMPVFRTYKLGNMFFFHGNIETSHITEKIGYYAVKTANSIGIVDFIPKQVAISIQKKYGTKNMYNFFGHIHLLEKYEDIKTTFCGTLNIKNMPFADSLGYVVAETDEIYNITSMEKIELKHSYWTNSVNISAVASFFKTGLS